MSLTRNILNLLFIAVVLYATFRTSSAYGQETQLVYYYYSDGTADDWPSIYYVLFGAFVAALVLFIMSVMTKPDELP